MPTTASMISAINVQIDSLIASPQVDYTEGDITVKNSQKMKQLLAAREALLKMPDEDLTLIVFHNLIDEFGIDRTQYF